MRSTLVGQYVGDMGSLSHQMELHLQNTAHKGRQQQLVSISWFGNNIQILTAHEGIVENYCPRGEIQSWPTIHRGP